MNVSRVTCAASLLAAVAAQSEPVIAQPLGSPDTESLAVGLVVALVVVPGVVATAVNTVQVTRWHRAPLFWRVLGFSAGGLLGIYGGYSMTQVSSGDRGIRVGILGIGVAMAGMALWTTLLPESEVPRRAFMIPSVLSGPLGSIGYGLEIGFMAL